MDIARLSMAMSQHHVKSQVSLQLMAKTMEMASGEAIDLNKMLEGMDLVHPDLGQQIDLKV